MLLINNPTIRSADWPNFGGNFMYKSRTIHVFEELSKPDYDYNYKKYNSQNLCRPWAAQNNYELFLLKCRYLYFICIHIHSFRTFAFFLCCNCSQIEICIINCALENKFIIKPSFMYYISQNISNRWKLHVVKISYRNSVYI